MGKTCRTCERNLPIAMFRLDSKSKKPLPHCRDCKSIYSKVYKMGHPYNPGSDLFKSEVKRLASKLEEMV